MVLFLIYSDCWFKFLYDFQDFPSDIQYTAHDRYRYVFNNCVIYNNLLDIAFPGSYTTDSSMNEHRTSQGKCEY